jgi:beta-glucosidase
MGGKALGEIIFGDVNPSGKLPLTFPRSVGQLQMIYNHKPTQYFRKYADEEITPLHCFGYGLSYSEFEYSNLNLVYHKEDNPHVMVSLLLINKSDFDGEEVVQVYFRDSYSSVTRPVKELVDYKRFFVKAHQSKSIRFKIPIKNLAFYDVKMEWCVEKGDFVFMVGGSSDSKDQLKDSIYVDQKYYFKK